MAEEKNKDCSFKFNKNNKKECEVEDKNGRRKK